MFDEIEYNKVGLHKAISKKFNLESLANLSELYLDVSLDDLPGSGKSGKVRELILYCERRGRIPDLLDACGEEFPPAEAWYEVAGMAPASDTAETTTPEPEPTSPTASGQLVFTSTSTSDQMTDESLEGGLKVFLSYATEDRPAVRQLYQQLVVDGYDPWLDVEKLDPGIRWAEAIDRAVEDAQAVIICLSEVSVAKESFVQKEIGEFIERSKYMLEGTIFLIPAKLNECQTPRALRDFQAVNLYEPGGYERMKASLEKRKLQLAGRG